MNANQPGGIDPSFIYADGLTGRDVLKARAAMPESGREKALSEAERNRLVRAAKSPTPNKTPKNQDLSTFEPIVEIPPFEEPEPERRARQFTVVQAREWADDFRIRTRTETPFARPPEQWGDRISEVLSDRGARKIADSCHYMALKKGGYRTFITGTFDPEARTRIKRRRARQALCREELPITTQAEGSPIKEAHCPVGFEDGIYTPVEWYWESGIQAEVSRCMDAINKMYMRGFYKESGEYVPSIAPVVGRKVGKVREGRQGPYTPVKYIREGLCYCWVAEVPDNQDAEENPHVHIMMNWQIDKEHWVDWSTRLEGVWNNGYFHLEKLNTPEYAGAYMAKAAGYFTKGHGKENSQGIVRGNRYGISKPARAPDWCTIGEYEMGVMGRLLAEISESMTQRHGEKYAERKRLNEVLENTPKKYKKKRSKIGKRLAEVRKEINQLPVRASKYQLVIKTKEYFTRFWGWACGMGWLPNIRPSSQWLSEFNKRLYQRKKRRELVSRKGWSDREWAAALSDYQGVEEVVERDEPDWTEYEQMAS